MQAHKEATLLRIFVGEEDRFEGRPLYEAIVNRALSMHMAGATVLPGPAGFGSRRHLRGELYVDAPSRLPFVIEIIDTDEKIEHFLPAVDAMIESGLVTLEKVTAMFYRRPAPDRPA